MRGHDDRVEVDDAVVRHRVAMRDDLDAFEADDGRCGEAVRSILVSAAALDERKATNRRIRRLDCNRAA